MIDLMSDLDNEKFAREYLESLNSMGSILGLTSIQELLFRLYRPQDSLKVIHIAGTNGKGSVGAMIAAVLQEAGYHVGRYSSPGVFEELETITIDGVNITWDEYGRILRIVKKANDKMMEECGFSATRFEIETAAAFIYFKNKMPDYVLIECGMGGDLDATNVFDSPLLSVITSISYDHMQFLGDSLAQIATHKAGILKQNCRAVAIHSQDESDAAIASYADEIHCELSWCSAEEARDVRDSEDGSLCFIHNHLPIKLPLIGAYQIANAVLAIHAVQILLPQISGEILVRGLMHTKWPGRFERIFDKPAIFIDGAHNPGGIRELCNTLRRKYPQHKFTFVIGVFADKDYSTELRDLSELAKQFMCIETPNHPRALPANKLAEMIKKNYSVPVFYDTDLTEAMHTVLSGASSDEIIVCCGSLSHLRHIKDIVKHYDR